MKSIISFIIAIMIMTSIYGVSDMNNPHVQVANNIITLPEISFYQYMTGYEGINIQKQPLGNNLYLTYMYKSSGTARRSVNYAFLNSANPSQNSSSTLTNASSNEGYSSMYIDPVSQNPFFAWHSKYSQADAATADQFYNVYLTADRYNLNNTPMNLFNRTKVIENSSDQYCYIWPSVFVSESPFENKRRIYVFTENSGNTNYGRPSSRVKMAYADFDNSLFTAENLSLQWNYINFDYLDLIDNSQFYARAYPSFYVKDNQIVIGGLVYAPKGVSAINDSTDIIYPAHDVFFLINNNFGEGEFSLYRFNTARSVDNPLNQNGTPGSNGFHSFEVTSYPTIANNLSLDNLNRVHYTANYVTSYLEDGTNNEENRKYFFASSSIKDLVFDISSQSLSIKDLYPKSNNPYDNLLFPCWDLNEDDLSDSYDSEGNWQAQFKQIPVYFYQDPSDLYPYSYFKQSKSPNRSWRAVIWSDCTKDYLLNEGDPNYLPYNNIPELALVFSRDNGNTWSNPVYLNSVDTPQLDNTCLSFSYLAPEIEEIDANTGRLHLMAQNLSEYAGALNPNTTVPSYISYLSIDVDFSQFTGSDEVLPNNSVNCLQQNYPNPFNPQTTISFSLAQTEKVKLSIYNIRGELVKELTNRQYETGLHKIIWNGKDSRGKNVASGIYYYKLLHNNTSEVRKMILLK
jgi:hypothetical protein